MLTVSVFGTGLRPREMLSLNEVISKDGSNSGGING